MTQAQTYQRFRIFQAKIEAKYTKQVRAIFISQANAFNEFAKVAGYPQATSKINDFFPAAPLVPVLNALHFEAGGKYGNDVYNQFKRAKSAPQALRTKVAVIQPGAFNTFTPDLGNTVVSILRMSLLTNVHGISDSAKEATLDAIKQGANEGWGYDKTATKIREDVGSQYRAQRIVRTESVKASNLGAIEGAKATGLKMNKVWLTARDNRVRGNPAAPPSHYDHYDLQGQTQPLERPFWAGEELDYPGDPKGSIGNIVNCFHENTLLEGQFTGGQRLKYSGEIIEIITRSGKNLSVTPNHPVFTMKGTIPAYSLTKGEYVLSNIKKLDNRIALINDYIEQKPILAAKIFAALNKLVPSQEAMVGCLDFHGDAQFGDGNVDIIDINRELDFSNIELIEDIGKFSLKSTHLERIFVSRLCSSLQFGNISLGTQHSFMSSPDLRGPLIGTHLRPFKYFSIGTSTNWCASRFNSTGDYATFDAGFNRKLLHGNTGNIILDEIVEVRNYHFNGHVYDFSTITGAILANNIYTSNCRCVATFQPIRDAQGRVVRATKP